eukprot:CAMPEP_0178886954 /NCGR_PEP_ID=MMETSP0747-20121128/16308_1 /TAXON_ID=913974 /ORGANISM="Nitzschia punctata, Strain CCMP561" /LENGTH=927 /DNA_ID=CAMNT_0020556021 /DNA_START=260 /DNA_END=3043 /DNA_ORIENTATION=-
MKLIHNIAMGAIIGAMLFHQVTARELFGVDVASLDQSTSTTTTSTTTRNFLERHLEKNPYFCKGPVLLPAETIVHKYCSYDDIVLFEEESYHDNDHHYSSLSGYGESDKKGKKKSASGKKKSEHSEGGKKSKPDEDCNCQVHIVGVPTPEPSDTVEVDTSNGGEMTMQALPIYSICHHDDHPIGVISKNRYSINEVQGKLDSISFVDGAITFFGKTPTTFAFAQQNTGFDNGASDLISNGRADIVGGSGFYDSGFIQPLTGLCFKDLNLVLIYGCKNGFDTCALPEEVDVFFKSPKYDKGFCGPVKPPPSECDMPEDCPSLPCFEAQCNSNLCQYISDCPNDRQFCTTEGTCAECQLNSGNCAEGLICNAEGRCVECDETISCPTEKPICGDEGLCIECVNNGNCTAPPPCFQGGSCTLEGRCEYTPICAANQTCAENQCVDCVNRNDCPFNDTNAEPVSCTNDTCFYTFAGECMENNNCSNNDTSPFCDPDDGSCQVCLDDGDCFADVCTRSNCNTTTGDDVNACEGTFANCFGNYFCSLNFNGLCIECESDFDCMDTGDNCTVNKCIDFRCQESPRCSECNEIDFYLEYCTDSVRTLCDNSTDPGTCVECLADTDCPADRPLCDDTGTCVQCVDDGDCSEKECFDTVCSSNQCVRTPRENCCASNEECDDDDPCTTDICQLNRCITNPPCGSDQVCKVVPDDPGGFQCVECLQASDCPNPNFPCLVPTCDSDNTCGIFPVPDCCGGVRLGLSLCDQDRVNDPCVTVSCSNDGDGCPTEAGDLGCFGNSCLYEDVTCGPGQTCSSTMGGCVDKCVTEVLAHRTVTIPVSSKTIQAFTLGKNLCYTLSDDTTTARQISRGCAAAEDDIVQNAKFSSSCATVEAALLSDKNLCTFVCNVDNCNAAPQLIPVTGCQNVEGNRQLGSPCN